PADTWRFADETAKPDVQTVEPPLTRRQLVYAWGPWALLSVMVFLWGWPSFKLMLNGGDPKHPNLLANISKVSFQIPRLHNVVYRASPVAVVPPGSTRAVEPEKAIYDFNWLSTTGTGIFLAAVLTALWLRIPPVKFAHEFLDTLQKMRWALLTIACMLALAF